MSSFLQLCLLSAIFDGQIMFAQGASCNDAFKGTEGVVTTPGFPNRLDYNRSCKFFINVTSGKIELTFQNVSIPDGTHVIFDEVYLIGQDRLQTRNFYTRAHYAYISFISPANYSGSYHGVKFRYQQLPGDTCKFNYNVGYKREIRSPGYPSNFDANVTCEYYLIAYSKDNVIQLAFSELSLGIGDVLEIYDAADDLSFSFTGPQAYIETAPLNSSSLKIVVDARSAALTVRRYALILKEVSKGICAKDYYVSLGVERNISSAGRKCVHSIRSQENSRLWLRFESINISPGNTVSVKLYESSGSFEKSWILSSSGLTDSTTVFSAARNGDWFGIEQPANVSFNLRITSYSADKCPFYTVSQEDARVLFSPGYPDNFSPNSTCEFHFEAERKTKVIHLKFSELFLSPGDNITVYDPSDGRIILRYNETKDLFMSVTTRSSSARVVFATANSNTTVGRRFKLFHQVLLADNCLVEYVGESGQFSSVNTSCEYKISSSVTEVELIFEKIYVPENSSIDIVATTKQKLLPEDSGKTRYFKAEKRFSADVITIRQISANALFHLKFQTFVSVRNVVLQGRNGTLLSPYYPQSYPRNINQIYHVVIPNGHVMLNVTEVRLAYLRFGLDFLRIYDGNTTSESAQLADFNSEAQATVPAWFLGSGNIITIHFRSTRGLPSSTVGKTYRFKALYMQQTQVNYCDALKWPNTRPERNLTLPGRSTKYFCSAGYINPDYRNFRKWVARDCDFNGQWEAGANLTCKKICPKLDEKLKKNNLDWSYSSYYFKSPFEGTYVHFRCSGYQWILNGSETITCTSHGNYSGPPPNCKKRADTETENYGSSDAWKYGVGVGGGLFIASIVIAVLRVWFGFFTCCSSASASSTLPMSTLSGEKIS